MDTQMRNQVNKYFRRRQTFDEEYFLDQFNDKNYIYLEYTKMPPNDLEQIHKIIYCNIWGSNAIIHKNMFLYQINEVKLPYDFLFQKINTINIYINIHGPNNIINLILNDIPINCKKCPYKLLEKMQTFFPTIVEDYYIKNSFNNDIWLRDTLYIIFKNSWHDQYLLLYKYIMIYIPEYKIDYTAFYINNIDIAYHAIDNDFIKNKGLIHVSLNFNSIDIFNKMYIQNKLSPYNMINNTFIKYDIKHNTKYNMECVFAKYLYYVYWFLNLKEQCEYLMVLNSNIIEPINKEEAIVIACVIHDIDEYNYYKNLYLYDYYNNKLPIEIKNMINNYYEYNGCKYNDFEEYFEQIVNIFKEYGLENIFLTC